MQEENKKQKEEKEKTKTEEKKIAEQLKKEQEKVKREEKKKVETEKKPKKTEAVVNAKDLPISTKHAVAICNFIRGKTIEKAILLLEDVLIMKKAIPMRGELPHRKGMERGRYPLKASQEFTKLLKQLSANAIVNNMEIEKAIIECKANKASRPYKRFGSERFKRTHVTLKLKEKEEKKQGEKK